jgi:DNA-binding CsgD family transcriptional regulator
MAGPPIFGRESETKALSELIDGVERGGNALVISGQAGIGKSTLLDAATTHARGRKMAVLTTTGLQSEARLPFAGLHQLLRPVLAEVEHLPGPQGQAVEAAFGISDSAAPDFFMIALGTLSLLSERARRSPLLLVVDDGQWLDHPTSDVLAFVGRRLEADPIVLLISVREGFDSSLLDSGLPEMQLAGLDPDAAAALLDAQGTELSSAVRHRLLENAAGNPLALLELLTALQLSPERDDLLSPLVPLTTRLERAFAGRMSELPPDTRTLLRVAAVDDGGVLAEILAAASVVEGTQLGVESLSPAISQRLVEIGDVELRFRHPLVRSAVYAEATVPDRHNAHAALAEVLADQPDRRVWHRAASLVTPDEQVAAELEEAADRARKRGAIAVAVAALQRAAHLSEEPARRGTRLMRAAELAFDLGRQDLVARLLTEAETVELGLQERARMTWIREMTRSGVLGDRERVALVDLAEQVAMEGDTDLALNLLWLVASRGWWAGSAGEESDRIALAAERTASATDDLRVPAILAYAAPVGRGPTVMEHLVRASTLGEQSAETARLLGSAALVMGAFDLAIGFLGSAVADLRAQGRLGQLARVLVFQAWSAFYVGDWKTAAPAAEEATRLATEMKEPIWDAGGRVVLAMLAGARGETRLAESLGAEAERAMLPMGASFLMAGLQTGRGLTALGEGHHSDAYNALIRTFDQSDPAYHPFIRCWAIGDLAEAAVQSGHQDAAFEIVAQLETLAELTPSPWFRAAMSYARPLLAADEEAEPLFRAALDTDMIRWPFYRGRLLLAYGVWLRRHRRVAESRGPLRAARDVFDALGATPWGERASQELRASGESSPRRSYVEWDQLTPQELQIAEMAAGGMSNREIGQQLYLSPRTVGSHLYRIFPKLGITSRHQLRTVLDAGSDPTPS